MSDFIVGIGTHAGSVWAAQLLNRPEAGVRVMNERLTRWSPGQYWEKKAHYMMRNRVKDEDPLFHPYFEQLRLKLDEFPVFMDFNSWAPPWVPQVSAIVPVAKVILLMRDGVMQLFSITSRSHWWPRIQADHFLISEFLQHLWRTGGASGKPWEKRTLWEKKCECWASTIGLIDWMREQGITVEVWKFEDLIANVDVLREFVHSIDPAREPSEGKLWGHQQNRINKHATGDKMARWQRWSEEQQIAFTEICGPGMARYGYETPEVGA